MGKIKEKKLQKKLKAVAKKQPPTKDDDEQPQKQSKQKQIKTKHVDVFEVEDTENVNELRKFEDIDVFDYELPSDFEDEEILSESDEELSSKTSKSTKSSKSASKTKKPLLREEDLLNEDIEDNENDIDMGEQEEDEEEDEYQNISDLLDEEPSSKPQKAPKSGRSKQHEEVEEDEEEEYSSQEDNDDEIDEGTHNKMLQSILDNKSKKKKKKEITESVPESEFNLKNTQEISMEDLMGTLNDVTGLADVKKQMAKLKKQKQLSEPLPKLVEDRLTREEATKKTDKDFEKWRDFSKELKHAPQLQFPLQEEEHTRLTTAQVVEEFHPITEMEKDIDQLLRATGVHKEQVEAADDLEHRMMTEDELQRKEVELAKMARLLFFQERKHKRQKKIKSKDYHRRLKKEREKNKLSLEELREIDPELAAQEEEKMLSKRIEERISLRHSKTKSQFSKHAIMHNEEARRAVQEQMEMKKQLLSKMNTMGNDEDSASDPEEDAQKLQEEEDLVGEERKHSKLMNMRFMQKGFEKEHATRNSAINMDDYEPSQAGAISAPLPGVIKEKNAAPQDWKVDAAETVPVPAPVVEKQTKKGKEGKTLPPETTFAPEKTSSNQDSKSAKNKKSSEPVLNSKQVPTQKASKGKEASIQIQDEASEQTTSEQPAKKNKSSKNNNKKDEDESNPWIAPENATKKVSQENKRMTIKSQERAKKKNEGTVQIKMENAINLDNLDKKVKKADKFDLNANSSTEQQDLISQAFTTEGVDYEAEFQALKQKEIQEELPEMENTELPGWGSWGGIGVSFSQQRLKEKRLQEKQKKFEAVLNELQKRRDDYTLGNVILNNGMTKQQTKYTVPTIPKNHTPVSYEKTLLMPLGREWNTTSNFQNNIKPKVDVKEGVAIQPVSMDTVKRHEESLVKKEKLLKRQIGAANAKPEKVPPKKKARSASSKL